MRLRSALILSILLTSLLLSGCVPTALELALDQISQASAQVTATSHEATSTVSSPLGLDSVTRVFVSSDEPNGELDELVARDQDFAKKLLQSYRRFGHIAPLGLSRQGGFFVSTLVVWGAEEEGNSIRLYTSESYAFYRLRDGKAIATETVPLLPAEVVIKKNLSSIRTISETGTGPEMASDLEGMMPDWARKKVLSLKGDDSQILAAQSLADEWAARQK